MNTFFTSDCHFGHANILKYEAAARVDEHGVTFQSVDVMHRYIVHRWNNVVASGDIVYCIGDLSFKRDALRNMLQNLNGKKILICGNHDPYLKRLNSSDPAKQLLAQQQAMDDGFESVHLEIEIEIDGIGKVKMNHFPYAPDFENDEDRLRHLNLRPIPTGEDILIHGHVHSQWRTKRQEGQPLMINAGMDVWDMAPLSVTELRRYHHEILMAHD